VKGGPAQQVAEGQVQEGDIAVAEKNPGTAPQGGEGQPGQEPAAAVAAPDADNGGDLRRLDRVNQILRPLRFRARKKTPFVEDVFAGGQPVSQVFEGAARLFKGSLRKRARRGHEGDGVTRLQRVYHGFYDSVRR